MEPRREMEVLMVQSSDETTKPQGFPFRCLRAGLRRESTVSHWALRGDLPFTILVAQSGEPTPQLSIVGEASYPAQDPLIGFNSDS